MWRRVSTVRIKILSLRKECIFDKLIRLLQKHPPGSHFGFFWLSNSSAILINDVSWRSETNSLQKGSKKPQIQKYVQRTSVPVLTSWMDRYLQSISCLFPWYNTHVLDGFGLMGILCKHHYCYSEYLHILLKLNKYTII